MDRRSKAVKLAVVPVLAAAFVGCGGNDDETAYCVNQYDEVVENRYCERRGTSGFFILYAGGGFYGRGQRIPRGVGTRIPSTDRARVAARGGFGGSARAGGVGRSVSARGGGGGGFRFSGGS